MTNRSLHIEQHETPDSAQAPYNRESRPDQFTSLNAYEWPTSSYTFATQNGLSLNYVDNCWSRVAVTGSQLRDFLALGLERKLVEADIIDRVDNDCWYVIEEEEF